MGIDALIAGNRDAAMKHLADAVREDPRNLDGYVKLGNLLRERGQIRQAIQVHRELLVKRKLPATVKNEIVKSLALDLAQAENWQEVLSTLKQLSRGERTDPKVLALTRDAYEAMGDVEHAVATHREILKGEGVKGEPSLGVYRAHLALQAYKKGDKVRARAEFRAALKDDASAAVSYLYLGDIAAAEEDNERAIAYWMKIVTEMPACAHFVFGRLEKAYFDVGDYGRMMGIYEEVVAKAPSNVHALSGLARMLERKGNIDEAVRMAYEAVKHEGQSLAGHRQLVELLNRNGRQDEAARVAEALLTERASDPWAPYCPSCGKTLKEPGWRCSSCRSWINAC